MTQSMVRSFRLFIICMALLSACNLPSSPPLPSGPTVPLPTTALPTPTLFLPSATVAALPATQVFPTLAPLATAAPLSQNPGVTFLGQHQIRTGETLFCIARAYGVLPAAIIQVNNIANVDALVVGQMLNIPQAQWTDMTAGQVCEKQFNSPFPAGPTAVVSNSPTQIPNFQDLKREVYLALGGGGGQGTDCVIEYEVSPPASTPAISGMWSASFLSNIGVICLFGFPLDQVLTVSLLDRQGGNILYVSSFIVQEPRLLQISSSGQILESAGYAQRDTSTSTSVIGLSVWPDPRVKFIKITAPNLVLESNLAPVRGVFIDFPDKPQAAFDPFGRFQACPDFPVGSEIHFYGFGFEGIQSAATKIFSMRTAGELDPVDAVHQTNDHSIAGIETLLTTDTLLTSHTIIPNPDGSFQNTMQTDSLLPSGIYTVEYEPNISVQSSASTRSCFTITNRQLVHADYLPTPPLIDGDTRDWAMVMDLMDRPTYGFENWAGFSDLSGWYSVGWDGTFLYIAASVVDDRYVQSQRDELLSLGDSLELLLGDPLSAPTTFRPNDYQLGFSVGNLQTSVPPVQAYLWHPSNKRGVPPSVIVKGMQKQSGYDMEIAIPWAVLERVPVLGQQFRFVLSMSDNDAEGTAVQQSLVSSNAGRILADPTTWGVLLLGD